MANQEKAKLLEHAQRVCETVLGSNSSKQLEIQVFVTQDDSLLLPISPTHQFMTFIDFTKAPAYLPTARKELASFLGKEVGVHDVDKSTCLYWGEGETLSTKRTSGSAHELKPSGVHPSAYAQPSGISWLKTDTILPGWLDRLLYESLNARYQPDWKRFEHNLDSDEDDLRTYLGTYFPRSYAEAFCMLDALFDNVAYAVRWKPRTEAHLLDIGCGTGGNLIGILMTLVKHFPQLETIHVEGIDGNAKALEFTDRVLSSFARQTQSKIVVTLTKQLIKRPNDLPTPTHDTYDFITSFKMGGEIISSGHGKHDDIYHNLLDSYIDRLSDIGVFVLLDVTTKPEHTVFYPQLLNHQVSAYIRDHAGYGTIFPTPCYFHEQVCYEHCFSQKEFSVSHRNAGNDLSRVAYRIIGRKALTDALHHDTQRATEYVINARSNNRTYATCCHSSGRGRQTDGFRKST